ncbi:MAG TPA: hypothetical protein DIW77_12220 [Chromatiaceae bacterium]|nr:hypothetical protein [Chromatiaceae bacterium]
MQISGCPLFFLVSFIFLWVSFIFLYFFFIFSDKWVSFIFLFLYFSLYFSSFIFLYFSHSIYRWGSKDCIKGLAVVRRTRMKECSVA